MSATNAILDNMRIASPCSANWDAMAGDGHARHCKACQKHVYNIASLPATNVIELIQQHEGKICVRLYRRADGTVLTANCPVGGRRVWQSVRNLLATGLIAAGLASAAAILPNVIPRNPTGQNTMSGRAAVLWDDLLIWMGFRKQQFILGDICLPPGSGVPSSEGSTETSAE